MGLMEPPSSWKVVKLVFLKKTRCGTEEGDQKIQSHGADISDVQVIRILDYSSSGKRERTWSGSQQQPASSCVVNPWRATDLGSSGTPARGIESFSSFQTSLLRGRRDRDFENVPLSQHRQSVTTFLCQFSRQSVTIFLCQFSWPSITMLLLLWFSRYNFLGNPSLFSCVQYLDWRPGLPASESSTLISLFLQTIRLMDKCSLLVSNSSIFSVVNMFLSTCWFTVFVKPSATLFFVPTFRNQTSWFVIAYCKYLFFALMCFIFPHPGRSAFALAADESVSRMMWVSSWYSLRISWIFFASASADTFNSTQLLPSSDWCILAFCYRASSVSEHDSSCAFSCLHTASPVTVTCGWAHCLELHWLSVRTSKCLCVCSPGIESLVSTVPNDRSLGNSFFVQALSLHVVHRVVVLPHIEVGPSLVDTILPTLLGAAPLSPSLFPSLGDRACSQDCTSPCPCLWGFGRCIVAMLWSCTPILFVPLFVLGFEFCHQLYSGSHPSSRGTFVSTFAPCHARDDHPMREARRPHARTGWRFPGSMYRELSILLGLSPRSSAASATASFQ